MVKPPATAAIEPGYRIGIDVGGTWTKGAIINVGSGTPVGGVRRLPTPSGGTADAVADVLNHLIDELGTEGGVQTPGAVGVAIPSIVQHGVARSAANMHYSWIGLDVQAYLQERLGLPVCVLNDADAAGLAEARYGAGQDKHGVVLVLTLGTGIGSALIVDGRLVPNLELGHLQIDGSKAESRASAVARERESLTWVEYSARLQRYLSHVEFLLSPDLVIIGGGISACSDEYLPLLSLRTPIVPALLENSAGVVGAALQAKTGFPAAESWSRTTHGSVAWNTFPAGAAGTAGGSGKGPWACRNP
jgi:polyphosphate glucokinase